MTASTPTTIREKLASSGRLARLSSRKLDRSEKSMDGQIGLQSIRQAVGESLASNRAEQDRDLFTDRQRVLKYRALATAIRSGDVNVAMAALTSAAAFEFADEMKEDAHRDGRVVADEDTERIVAELHSALYDLTPALVEGLPLELIQRQQNGRA